MASDAMAISRAEGTAVQSATSEASGLVKMAIEQKVPVEVLERLVALQERVTDRDAVLQLNQALGAFQAACPPIFKAHKAEIVSKRTGSKFSYRYANLEDIVRHIRRHLEVFGLSYTWDSTVNAQTMTVTCVVRHIAGASVSASFSCPVDGNDRMSAAQSAGAAMSYARRQSLVSVLGLTTADEDTDGSAAPEPESNEPVNREQLANLEALYDEVHKNVDFEKFCAYFQIGGLSDLPQSRYAEAIAMLERKRT